MKFTLGGKKRGESVCSKWAYYQELMVCVIWPLQTQEPGNEAIATHVACLG